jgi:hypothetical protein
VRSVPCAAWHLQRDCRVPHVCERLGRQASRARSGRSGRARIDPTQTPASPGEAGVRGAPARALVGRPKLASRARPRRRSLPGESRHERECDPGHIRKQIRKRSGKPGTAVVVAGNLGAVGMTTGQRSYPPAGDREPSSNRPRRPIQSRWGNRSREAFRGPVLKKAALLVVRCLFHDQRRSVCGDSPWQWEQLQY